MISVLLHLMIKYCLVHSLHLRQLFLYFALNLWLRAYTAWEQCHTAHPLKFIFCCSLQPCKMDLTELFSARLYLKLLFVQEEMTSMTANFQQKVPNPEVPSH